MRRLTLLLVFLTVLSSEACSKKAEVSVSADTLVLKNGGKIQCQIVRETPDKLIVQYQDGQVEFLRSEVQEILRGQKLTNSKDGIETQIDRDGGKILRQYPYVRTMDGKSHYGKKLRKEEKNFILEKDAGEAAETIPQEKIEKIFIGPPAENKTLSYDFKKLMEKNPQKVNEIEPYVIYSDVESSDFVLYRNAMEGVYHRFMTYLFELVDTSKPPEWALGVILYAKYEDYTKSGGPPKTAGYYRPDDHVLRLYNMREMEAVQAVLRTEEKFQNDMGKKLSSIESSSIGAETGKWKQYDLVEKLQDAVEKNRMHIEQVTRSETMETIRHEGAHQILNLFGVDRDFRGVWFSEGVADYLAPEEYNGLVLTRIMSLKAELEEGRQLIPLDFMMTQPSGGHIYNFKDFHLTAQFYSQSWAFVHMLMNHYPKQFLAYMLELKNQKKGFDAENDKALFQKHIGRKLSELDKELETYVAELAGRVNQDEYLFFKHASLRMDQQKKDFKDSIQNLL